MTPWGRGLEIGRAFLCDLCEPAISAAAMSNFFEERVLSVHHWTDSLLSFTTTRDPGFRFENGQFTMIGLPNRRKAAPARLQPRQRQSRGHAGILLDQVAGRTPDLPAPAPEGGRPDLVGRKATGTLLLDNLRSGRHLYLLGDRHRPRALRRSSRTPRPTSASSTSCSSMASAKWRNSLMASASRRSQDHEFLGDFVRDKLIYHPTVTREPFRNQGRITDLIVSAAVFEMASCRPSMSRTTA